MNIRQLNEVFNLQQDGKFKYADIDAKAVYDNCINKDHGSHTFEEANKFKEFVGITPETTEEELRGIRNTLVRYWADACEEYNGDDWGRSRTEEESNRNFKMGDQMQFFTTVIDMAINDLPEEKRIHEDYDQKPYRVAFTDENNYVFDIHGFDTYGEAEEDYQKVCNETPEKSAVITLDKLEDGEYEQVKRFNVYSGELMESKIKQTLAKFEEFDPEETKTPNETDLDDIYDAINTLNKSEYFVNNEKDLDVLLKAQEILQRILNANEEE